MFFSRLALFALPAIAAAGVIPRTQAFNSCNIGSTQQCCNSVQSVSQLSGSMKGLLGLAGGNLDNLTGQVGFTCSPVTVPVGVLGGGVGASSAGCNQQNLCCQHTSANGAIALNCTPVIINA